MQFLEDNCWCFETFCTLISWEGKINIYWALQVYVTALGALHSPLFHAKEEAGMIRIVNALYKWGNLQVRAHKSLCEVRVLGWIYVCPTFKLKHFPTIQGLKYRQMDTSNIVSVIGLSGWSLQYLYPIFRNLEYSTFTVIGVNHFGSVKHV